MAAAKFISNLCGKYVFIDSNKRLYAYFLVVTVLSFCSRLFDPLPQFYLTQKRNFLNDYFVKMGMFWTTTLLLPFIFFTSKVYSGPNWWNICRQLSRVIVTMLFWYVITALFVRVENWTGSCSLTAYTDGANCSKHGGHWYSFEISGHCFLLVYCALTLVEELAVFRCWEEIPAILSRTSSKIEKTKLAIIDQHNAYSAVVQILFIAISLLLILWDVMFVITSLYYHTWVQKVSGLAFATAGWYLTYGSWYRTAYSPGMPGESPLGSYFDLKRSSTFTTKVGVQN